MATWVTRKAAILARMAVLPTKGVSALRPRRRRSACHQRRRLVDLPGEGGDRAGHHAHLLSGFLPLPLLDGLADGGEGLDAVAGVEAGGVDLVDVPAAAREAGGGGQGAHGLHQDVLDAPLALRGPLLPAGVRRGPRLGT